jgi:predicted RecB family nuclease
LDLTAVKGVGASAQRKLKAAGIETIEHLAELDLRKVDIVGLSADHLAQLRDSAQRFLAAQQKRGDLSLVQGLGPSSRRKLEESGIATIEALANLDLRKTDVDGLSTEHLQRLKRAARYLL